jgi:hypothetical protein
MPCPTPSPHCVPQPRLPLPPPPTHTHTHTHKLSLIWWSLSVLHALHPLQVAELLDLDPSECERPEFALLMAGAAPLPGRCARGVGARAGFHGGRIAATPKRGGSCGCLSHCYQRTHPTPSSLQCSEPYAQCYGGHQFGQWAGQLGDGRAITLGEVRGGRGCRRIQSQNRTCQAATWQGVRTCPLACTRARLLSRARACTCSCARAYTHTQTRERARTHARTHTHIHAHTHKHAQAHRKART